MTNQSVHNHGDYPMNIKTIQDLQNLHDTVGFANLTIDQLIELEGLAIANIDSGTWEHTEQLQSLFDAVSRTINFFSL